MDNAIAFNDYSFTLNSTSRIFCHGNM